MPVNTYQYSLPQGTAVLVVPNDNMAQEVIIHNHEHALGREIFIGGDSSVTDTNGIHAVSKETYIFTIRPGDELWAYTAESNGADLHVMTVRKSN